MKNFKEWLAEEELKLQIEGRWGALGGLAAAALSSLGGMVHAGDQKAPDTHSFQGTSLVTQQGVKQQLEPGEIFIKALTQHSEQVRSEMTQNPYIKSFTLEIINHQDGNKNETASVVEISAEVQAPTKEMARQILVQQLMKVSAKSGLQGNAIKALKQLNLSAHENVDQVFVVKAQLSKDGGRWTA
jgi:hypothetical protein